jgi:hypothetical protein
MTRAWRFVRKFEEQFCLAWGLDDYPEPNYEINILWEELEFNQGDIMVDKLRREECRVATTFLEGLPEVLVNEMIWPYVVGKENSLDAYKKMVMVKAVCQGWSQLQQQNHGLMTEFYDYRPS